MAIHFEDNSYLFAVKASARLQGIESVENFVKKGLCFNYGLANFQQFNNHYVSDGGVGKKVIALPALLWFAGIKTIYHLAIGVFNLFAQVEKPVKEHMYYAARELQEGLGWLLVLLVVSNEAYGLYHIQGSRFHKSCYDYFIAGKNRESPPLKIENRHSEAHSQPSEDVQKIEKDMPLLAPAYEKREEKEEISFDEYAKKRDERLKIRCEASKQRIDALDHMRKSLKEESVLKRRFSLNVNQRARAASVLYPSASLSLISSPIISSKQESSDSDDNFEDGVDRAKIMAQRAKKDLGKDNFSGMFDTIMEAPSVILSNAPPNNFGDRFRIATKKTSKQWKEGRYGDALGSIGKALSTEVKRFSSFGN